jgi:quercetin dioxygenase-like cupin family protein
MKFVWSAIAIGLIASSSHAADNKAVVTLVLTADVTATGQPFTFPTKNAQLVVATYEIPEGSALPEHKHPYPRFGYVLAGALQVTNTETGKTELYKAGDFIPEAIDQWHQGAAVGTGPAKLLVIDVTEKGQSNVTPKR